MKLLDADPQLAGPQLFLAQPCLDRFGIAASVLRFGWLPIIDVIPIATVNIGHVQQRLEPQGHVFVADIKTKTFNVPVGIAAGPWLPVGHCSKESGAAMGLINHSLVFSRGFEANGSGAVIVSHDYFDDDFRVVAYDKQGAMHAQQGRGGSSAGRIYQCEAHFSKLPLDQIDRFEFQTRPFEWVEFEDLPLNPAP